MEEKKRIFNEDISKEIERSSISQEKIVSTEIAQKEERIAKAVTEMPIIRDEIKERKIKIINFFKNKKERAFYLILAFIILISIYIRSRNIPLLKDITTGSWTLGPDLDPFLFLRWAQEIVTRGSLSAIDLMRNVPLGFNTAGEMKLLSYMIVWLYKFLSFFSSEVTVTYAGIIFPVVMAALTAIAFFLFAKKIFYKEDKTTKNIIALISTFIFVLVPSLLPRTIAGIPEKESAAFFFMFMAFYFFLEAFTSIKIKRGLLFGVLAGISTALTALIWGGVLFIFFTIPTAVLLAFILGKIKTENFIIYSTWLITSFIVMMPFSTRYALKNLIMSLSTGFGIGVLILIGISLFIMKINLFKKIRKKTKLPKEIFSIIISIIILIILASIFFGPIFLLDQILEIKNSLIVPTLDRFSMTVAENRQPYFINDWKDSFGPIIFNIPLFFWLFFVGSVVLFHDLIKSLRKKERIILTFVYALFLFCLVFSRYSANSILNGVNFQSLFVYFGGLLIFVGSFLYFYHKKYKEGSFFEFQKLEFTYILYFLILTLGLIGARGGIRLIMVLGAISPVAIGFLVVKSFKKYLNSKEDTTKLFLGILILVIILASLFTIWSYYKSDKYVSENFAPGPYQWQWQKAMDWVRMNTAENAVFAHWWDYGYWLQSIGNRATILDGGNAISYWNHLMGRYVLTGTDEQTALDFLYSHNGTHLLIDSTEVGKYTAFSSIGSDVDYDRFSWITTYLMDEKQTQEMNNKTIYFYQGGASLDEDLEWEINGEKMFFPKKAAGVGAIIVGQQNGEEITQPTAIIVYNGGQYSIPLRFAYYAGELHDFGSGLDAGVFFFPKINIVSGQANINNIGALFYLSSRTIHSHLANLYLFDKQTNAFKLVHTEDNLFIENLKTQGVDVGNFVYYQGFQGPIKIWEINYPANMGVNEEFLKTEHPEEIKWATKGEY